jgi:hypothetical protein
MKCIQTQIQVLDYDKFRIFRSIFSDENISTICGPPLESTAEKVGWLYRHTLRLIITDSQLQYLKKVKSCWNILRFLSLKISFFRRYVFIFVLFKNLIKLFLTCLVTYCIYAWFESVDTPQKWLSKNAEATFIFWGEIKIKHVIQLMKVYSFH